MPTILTSSGTGDNENTARMNAMATLSAPMNDAAESQIISQTVEHTPNGFVVNIQVMVLSEEEVLNKDEAEPENDEEGSSGGDKSSVEPARAEHDSVADIAYLQSAQALERERGEMHDRAIDEIAHPERLINDTLPADFEEASQPVSDNDEQPVFEKSASAVPPPVLPNGSEPIMTTLSVQEIDDSVSHEMLSGDVVDWQQGQAAAMANGPKPPEPLLEEEFEEFVTPEGKLVRRPKKPHVEDSLDLAI